MVGTTATNTTAKPQINSKGIEFFPVHGENVDSYDAIFYNDRICIVVYRGMYEHKYSGRILETVMQPSEILMRITANGMAMMPEHFPQEPVLAGQAKKGMVIMIRDRPCQIRDVTLNKVGEATVVHIQASALRNDRWENIEIPADAPLEFPGHKYAIGVVQKALAESGCNSVTELDNGLIKWAPTAVSANTILEQRQVEVEVVDKEVEVANKEVEVKGEKVPTWGQYLQACRSDKMTASSEAAQAF